MRWLSGSAAEALCCPSVCLSWLSHLPEDAQVPSLESGQPNWQADHLSKKLPGSSVQSFQGLEATTSVSSFQTLAKCSPGNETKTRSPPISPAGACHMLCIVGRNVPPQTLASSPSAGTRCDLHRRPRGSVLGFPRAGGVGDQRWKCFLMCQVLNMNSRGFITSRAAPSVWDEPAHWPAAARRTSFPGDLLQR